jgi:hypothetical protein
MISRITASKQGIISTSDQDSNITQKYRFRVAQSLDPNLHIHRQQVVLFRRVHKVAKQETQRK